jgi:hypothetical protein
MDDVAATDLHDLEIVEACCTHFDQADLVTLGNLEVSYYVGTVTTGINEEIAPLIARQGVTPGPACNRVMVEAAR